MVILIFGFLVSICNAQVDPTVFAEEAIQHRDRILDAAKWMTNSKKFVEYLKSFHDVPKFMTLDELKKWGYTNSQTIAERLSKFHGKSLGQLAEIAERKGTPEAFAEMKELAAAIKDLNLVESKMKQFALSSLTKAEANQFRFWEEVVDIVDVYMMRFKELGIVRDLNAPFNWFINRFDLNAAEAAEKLVREYYVPFVLKMPASYSERLMTTLSAASAAGKFGSAVLSDMATRNLTAAIKAVYRSIYPEEGQSRSEAAVDGIVDGLTYGYVPGFRDTRLAVMQVMLQLHPEAKKMLEKKTEPPAGAR